MLQQLKETSHGYPSSLEGSSHAMCEHGIGEANDDEGAKRWDDILSEMFFLLNEANEDKSTRKNKYQKEYEKAHEEFENKYGVFGEKLLTKAEKAEEKKNGTQRVYMLGDLPEYL